MASLQVPFHKFTQKLALVLVLAIANYAALYAAPTPLTNNNTASITAPVPISNDNTPINLQQVNALSGQANNNQASMSNSSTALEPGAFQGQGQTRLWNLQDVDIRSVIDEISRETGKNFIVDPRVQGKITIVSSTPMDANESYQVFLSSLQVLGYAAVPSGQVIKIMPQADAKMAGTMVGGPYNPGVGDELVARVLPLQNISAEELAPLLRPLLPDWATLTAYEPSNVLIVVATATSIRRLAEIVNKVDSTNANGIDMLTLHYASAIDVVNTIQSLQDSAKSEGITPDVTVAADAASNSVLLSGNKQARLKMRVLISELDSPTASNAGGNTQVIYLHYLRAQDLVPILAGVAESYYRGPVGTVIGTRTQIGTDYAATDNGNDDNDDSSSSTAGNGSTAATISAPASNSASANNSQTNQQAQVTETDTNNPNDENKPKVELIAEPNTNSIVINAPPALMRTLKGVIRQLDIRPAEVLVEALIAEVDQQTSDQLGIQWGAFTLPNQTGIEANDSIAGFRAGIGIITGKGIHNLEGIINALNQDKNANILSTPAVLVLDNHQAKIEVGQEVSIQQSTYPGNAAGTTTATPYATFDREKVALHLYVTPQINQGNSIQLSIDQGNDTLQDPEDVTTTPVVNISSIKTSVLINSGNIIVLGGLIQNQYSAGNNRLPFLGDIPVVGHLFRADTSGIDKKDLMVFLRPVIVSNPGNGVNVTEPRYNFIREQQLAWMRAQYYNYFMNQTVLPALHQANLPHPFPNSYN